MSFSDCRKLFGIIVLMLFIDTPVPAAVPAAENPVEGSYLCESVRSKPCTLSNTPLQLTNTGAWRWGRYAGHFTIQNGRIQFNGIGGPATWGSAIIGRGWLNFNDFGDNGIWRKVDTASPRLTGTYFCRTAPNGCMTSHPLEIREDGTWVLGSQSGDYSVVGEQMRFRGGLSGGPGGKTAQIGHGALNFRTPQGDSVWSTNGLPAERSHAVRFTGNPRAFDLSGFPPQPTTFDEQRIVAAIRSARDPGNTAHQAVLQEQAHRMLGQWYLNHGDQQRGVSEQQKALYWKNGDR